MKRIPEFGARFREVMAGRSQEEIAGLLGASQSTVSRMTGGFLPGLAVRLRMERVFGFSWNEWNHLIATDTPEPINDGLTVTLSEASLNRLADLIFARIADGLGKGFAEVADKMACRCEPCPRATGGQDHA